MSEQYEEMTTKYGERGVNWLVDVKLESNIHDFYTLILRFKHASIASVGYLIGEMQEHLQSVHYDVCPNIKEVGEFVFLDLGLTLPDAIEILNLCDGLLSNHDAYNEPDGLLTDKLLYRNSKTLEEKKANMRHLIDKIEIGENDLEKKANMRHLIDKIDGTNDE